MDKDEIEKEKKKPKPGKLLFGLISTFGTIQVKEEKRDGKKKERQKGFAQPQSLVSAQIHWLRQCLAWDFFNIMTINFLLLKKKSTEKAQICPL